MIAEQGAEAGGVKRGAAAENPLFLFADAPEVNIPDRKDPNVIWFEAGRIHDIGEKFTIKYTGKVSGDTITGKTQFGDREGRDWKAERVKEEKK